MKFSKNNKNYFIICYCLLIFGVIIAAMNNFRINYTPLTDSNNIRNYTLSTTEIPIFWANTNGYQFSDNTPSWKSCSMSYNIWYDFTINYNLSVNIYLALVVSATQNFVGQDPGWEGNLKINGKTVILFDQWTNNGTYTWFAGDNKTIIRNRTLWWDITPFL
ncbi:MAG: hypothetical protein ACTSPQ_20945, partial [Candidatus Helarchaeota archaeon]